MGGTVVTPFDNIQTAAPQSQVATPFDNIQDTQTTPSGQITNDVGQQVVVPKDGESFTDTVNRAKALQQQREQAGTQQQALDAETKTIPAKTAQTLAGAATIGAVGPALLAAPGEIAAGIRAVPGVTEALLQNAEKSAGEWAAQYPHLIKIAGTLGVPTSTAALLGWLYHKSK